MHPLPDSPDQARIDETVFFGLSVYALLGLLGGLALFGGAGFFVTRLFAVPAAANAQTSAEPTATEIRTVAVASTTTLSSSTKAESAPPTSTARVKARLSRSSG